MQSLRVLLAAVLLTGSITHSWAGAVIREPGAIYLEDLVPKPIRLKVLEPAPIYYHSDMGRYLGVLKKGQHVELQAVADHAYRVRGIAQQGQVAGWVEPEYLDSLKKEFVQSLKQNAARKEEVAALVARNEVAVNMTPEEVLASLGKPAKKTSRVDAEGREDIWEFVRFERIPKEVTGYDRFGRLVSNVVYVKVPAGRLSVVFVDNLVTAMEQTEGSLEKEARVKIVPAPFPVAF